MTTERGKDFSLANHCYFQLICTALLLVLSTGCSQHRRLSDECQRVFSECERDCYEQCEVGSIRKLELSGRVPKNQGWRPIIGRLVATPAADNAGSTQINAKRHSLRRAHNLPKSKVAKFMSAFSAPKGACEGWTDCERPSKLTDQESSFGIHYGPIIWTT